MRSARPREEHRAALDRRLEQLQAELAGVRPAPAEGPAGTRVRRAPAVGSGTDTERGAETPQPGPLPVPGRHAARRERTPGAGPAGRAEAAVPEGVRPAVRWAFAPGHLRVIALLVVVALLASGWWLLRSRPEALPGEVGLTVSEPSPTAAAAESEAPGRSGTTASRGSGAAAAAAGEVVVHVAGRVRRPGIVRLPPGARVVEALEAAGGARPGVPLRDLNLARALVDGEQVLVGLPGAAAPATAPAPAATASEPGAPVNLNTADQTLLETLPGVGPVTAGKILAWREEHGRFTAVEELLEVDGIGEVTLADLTPLVTV